MAPSIFCAVATSRLDSFREMVTKNPTNALAHYGLANEAMKESLYQEAADHYAAYLGTYDDEGNGFGRYAEALAELGRLPEAQQALQSGIAAAHRFGHPSMASELEVRLESLSD
jgi:tetratricopeptide (TPR) repeat protein